MTDRFVFEKYSKSEEKSPQDVSDVSLSEIRSWRAGSSIDNIEINRKFNKQPKKRHSKPLLEDDKLSDLRTSVSRNSNVKVAPVIDKRETKKEQYNERPKKQSSSYRTRIEVIDQMDDTYEAPSNNKVKTKKKKKSNNNKSEIQLYLEQFSFVNRFEEFIENYRIPFLIGISFVQFFIFFLIFVLSFNQNSRGSIFGTKFLTVDAKNQLVSNKEYNNSWKFNVGDLVIVKKTAESDLETGTYIAVYTDESKGDFLIREINKESSDDTDNELVMQPENGEVQLLTLSKDAYIGKVNGQYKHLGTLIQKIMSFKIIIIIITTLLYCLLIYISLVWIR